MDFKKGEAWLMLNDDDVVVEVKYRGKDREGREGMHIVERMSASKGQLEQMTVHESELFKDDV